MGKTTVHILTDLALGEPFAVSLLIAAASRLGFEAKIGNKSISFVGPELNTLALSYAAKDLKLTLLPGLAPQEIAHLISSERSIDEQLRAAKAGDLKYRSANQALKGRGR